MAEWAERIRVQPRQVRVQPMRRKWASCSTRGTVCFSTAVLTQPAEFREYVSVHELVHLKVPNHGKLFKTLLSMELATSMDTNQNPLTGSPIGSGLLVESPHRHILLVTAKHVVINPDGSLRSQLAYRFNHQNTKSDLIFDVHMQKHAGPWFVSANADVACRLVVVGQPDARCLGMEDFLLQTSLQPGAPVLVIGFPLGLRSEKYTVPILRQGIIAHRDATTTTLDAFVFPGNSGGPVVYAPPLAAAIQIHNGPATPNSRRS